MARDCAKSQMAFETVFGAMVEMLGKPSQDGQAPNRATARAIAALCIGGMVVARAMATEKEATALRAACQQVALQLGGWDMKAARARKRRR